MDMARIREDCGLRIAGQEIDISAGLGVVPLPPLHAPALAAVLAARVDGVSVRLWRVGRDWSIPPRTLDDDFLFLPLAGRIRFSAGGEAAELVPGRLGVAAAGAVHAAAHVGTNAELRVVAVHAHVRDAGGAPLLAGLRQAVVDLPDHAGWAGRLLAGAVVATPGGDLLGLALRHLLAELAMLGLALRQPRERGDARLAPAFAAMHERPHERHAIPALARACGLGVVRFRVLFHASAGCAPKTYLDNLRLARARTLLGSSTAPVAAIAAACGFATTRHFLARFRAATGLTPTGWRRGGAREP